MNDNEVAIDNRNWYGFNVIEFSIILKGAVKMSKWDDDFDFDDDAPKNKKAQPEKKKIGKDHDFFDEDDTNKLPSIGSKNTISK